MSTPALTFAEVRRYQKDWMGAPPFEVIKAESAVSRTGAPEYFSLYSGRTSKED